MDLGILKPIEPLSRLSQDIFNELPWVSSVLSGIIAGIVTALILKKWGILEKKKED